MRAYYFLQTDGLIAIFDLRSEYVISVHHLKHIHHNLLLMVRRSFSRFGALTRIFIMKYCKSKLSVAGTWSRDAINGDSGLKGIRFCISRGEMSTKAKAFTNNGNVMTWIYHGGKATGIPKIIVRLL